jgi:hypothetical protein
MAIIDSIFFLFIVNMGRKCLCLTPTDCLLPGRFGLIGSDRAHIISVGSDRFVVGFRSGFGRDWTESNEIRIGSDLKFIGFRSIPTKSGLESDRKESDNNPIGSDRFLWKMSDSDEIRRGSDRFRLDLQVGLNLLGLYSFLFFLYDLCLSIYLFFMADSNNIHSTNTRINAFMHLYIQLETNGVKTRSEKISIDHGTWYKPADERVLKLLVYNAFADVRSFF